MTYRIPLDDILGVEDSITPFDIICFFLLVTFGPYFAYTCYTHGTNDLSAVIWHDAARCLGHMTHISSLILGLLFGGVWRTLLALQFAFNSLLWAFGRACSTVASILSYIKRLYHAVSILNAVQAENQRLRLDAATNRRNLATVTAEKDLFQQAFEERWSQARLYKVFPDAKPADWDTPHRCNENCGLRLDIAMREVKQSWARECALKTKLEKNEPNAICSECPKLRKEADLLRNELAEQAKKPVVCSECPRLRKEKDDAVTEKTKANAATERMSKELEQNIQGAICFNCATLRMENATAEEESARLRTKLEQAEKPAVCSECPRLRKEKEAADDETGRLRDELEQSKKAADNENGRLRNELEQSKKAAICSECPKLRTEKEGLVNDKRTANSKVAKLRDQLNTALNGSKAMVSRETYDECKKEKETALTSCETMRNEKKTAEDSLKTKGDEYDKLKVEFDRLLPAWKHADGKWKFLDRKSNFDDMEKNRLRESLATATGKDVREVTETEFQAAKARWKEEETRQSQAQAQAQGN